MTATANSGYSFVNWTENSTEVSSSADYNFTLNGSRNLVANFTSSPVTYTIAVSASPGAGGSVSGAGTFSAGTLRTVSATATTGYTFRDWSENGQTVSLAANYTFNLNSSRSLVARFVAGITRPSFADFNRDGKSDILWRHDDGFLSLWLMDGATLGSTVTPSPQEPVDRQWKIQGIGDFDGDGNADMLLRHTNGSISIWFMDGSTLRIKAPPSVAQVSDLAWQIQGAGDFDGDGKSDILWRRTDGWLAIWFMEGNQVKASPYVSPAQIGDINWQIEAIADFNRDGRADILFRHRQGTLSIWLMNGTTRVGTVAPSIDNVADSKWQIQGAGDYDGDGNADILWRHSDGWLSVWLMEGTRVKASPFLVPDRVADLKWQIQPQRTTTAPNRTRQEGNQAISIRTGMRTFSGGTQMALLPYG